MDDPAKVVIALSFFASIALSVRAIAHAAVRYQEVQLKDRNPVIPSAIEGRLERIEQAVDSIAVEVERISEGQRFTAKLLSERSAVPH
jgi:hypothetical protein